jgi:hypothetical protein
MNLYTLSRRATSTTHPSLLHTSFAFTKPHIIARIPAVQQKCWLTSLPRAAPSRRLCSRLAAPTVRGDTTGYCGNGRPVPCNGPYDQNVCLIPNAKVLAESKRDNLS